MGIGSGQCSDNLYSHDSPSLLTSSPPSQIQDIKNAFAVKVYECHARIALERLDTTEYNQCQTRLMDLYPQNEGQGNPEVNTLCVGAVPLPDPVLIVRSRRPSVMSLFTPITAPLSLQEFLTYRILYYIYIKNTSDAMKLIAKLSAQQKSSEDVKFGVSVFNAWTARNYYRFFKLYLTAPKMSGYLMDTFVQRERNAAMCSMVKAYKPTITVAKVTSTLGYPDTETAMVYLDELKVAYTNPSRTAIDCKKTTIET